MEGISDIKICGFDELRPPIMKKEPYIDLIFKLSHKAPSDWCADFNQLVSKGTFTTNIKPDVGLFIETWVRKPEEIKTSFERLKKAVTTCNEEYIAKIQAATAAANSSKDGNSEASAEQTHLNSIIAGLDFD